MQLALIWAMTRNRVIGRDNDLPWQLPDEMRHFVRTTKGKPVIMGRKQWQSMPGALPGRANIVLSRDPAFQAEGAQTATTIPQALALAVAAARQVGASEIMVIGGAEIYALFMDYAQRLYATLIEAELPGDTFFPVFDDSDWQLLSTDSHAADARHPYAFHMQVLERRGRPPLALPV